MAQYRRKSDGVTSMTKKRLVAEGLNRPEDFNMPMPVRGALSTPPSGDPTRRMPMPEYNVAAAAAKKRTDAAYLKSKMKRKVKIGY